MPCANCTCLFRDLAAGEDPHADDRIRCLVLESAQCVRYDKGEMLFLKGQPSFSLYSLASGMVKICDHTADGREQIVGFSTPGNLLVGLQSLTQNRYAYSASAATPVRACRVNHRGLMTRLRDEPRLALRLMDALSAQLNQSRALIQVMGHKNAAAKIASFLLLMTPESGRHNGRFRLPLSRLEIANLLGLSEETVCRLMADLKRQGLIHAPRGTIEIRDRDQLRIIADGTH